jgi:hypothetical protein
MPKASKTTASDTVQVEGYEGHFETGDAYYVPAGHTPVLYAGSEVVEFISTQELHETLEIVEKNMTSATD